jgi:hypothetical protein
MEAGRVVGMFNDNGEISDSKHAKTYRVNIGDFKY